MNSTFSCAGKTIRMGNIFQEDDKTVIVAINQGFALGPTKGISAVEPLIRKLSLEGPDSFILHRGMAVNMVDIYYRKAALILKATNRTPFLKGVEEAYLSNVNDAILLGADAISVGLSLADEREWYTVSHISKLISEAMKYGIPTAAHAYPNGNLLNDEERYKVENVGKAVRVALELGIDIIKTFWTGSCKSFEEIVKIGEPAKVIISGGPRCATLRECFDMTWQGMQAGAKGIAYGRNIWQHPYPNAVLRGLIAIVHRGVKTDEAIQIASDAAGISLE